MPKTSVSDAVQLLSTEIRTDGEPVTPASPAPTELEAMGGASADGGRPDWTTLSHCFMCAEPGRVEPVRKCYRIREGSSLLFSKEQEEPHHTHRAQGTEVFIFKKKITDEAKVKF